MRLRHTIFRSGVRPVSYTHLDVYKRQVTGVEMFRKLLDQGEAGDNVGLLLRGIDKNEITRGMVICHQMCIRDSEETMRQS